MSVSLNKYFFSNNQSELILKSNLSRFSNFNFTTETYKDDTFWFFTSLINSGYFFQAIHLIKQFLSDSTNLEPNFHIEVLLLLSEAYVNCYDYNEAEKILDKIKFLSKTNKIDKYDCFYELLNASIPKKPEEFEFINNSLIKTLNNTNKIEYNQLPFCLTKRGIFYRNNEKFDLALLDFEESLKMYSSNGNMLGQGQVYFQIGYLYLIIDKLDESVQNFEKASSIYHELGNHNYQAYALTYLGLSFTKKGNYNKSNEILTQALQIPKLFQDDYITINIKEKLAQNYFYYGELKKALDYYFEVESAYRKNRTLKDLGGILNRIGIIKSVQGKFDDALVYHKEALEIFTSIHDLLGIPWSNIYLGDSLFEMGDYDSALVFWIKSYQLLTELQNEHGIGFASLHIAKTYLILNDERSEEYYRIALKIFERIQNHEGLVESYIGYGIILEEQGYKEESGLIFEKARNLVANSDKKYSSVGEKIYNYALITFENSLGNKDEFLNLTFNYYIKIQNSLKNNLRREFLTAVKLNSTNRLAELVEAFKIFESITKREIIDFHTTVLSYLYILETIIFEIKIFNNVDIIKHAYSVLENLLTLTATNNLSCWSIRALALKSQIKLIEFKYDEAKLLLKDAIQTANSKKMKRLVFQLSNQYDNLVSQIIELEDLRTSKNIVHSVSDVLRITDFSIFDSNRNKFNLQTPDEEPTYFSIINTSGITLYSYNFNSVTNSTEEFDQLMSGFLMAINSVLLQLFSSSGFIERIKHKEYTLTFFSLTDLIYICYAYKGSSYNAETKIKQFKEYLLNNPFMSSILEASNSKRTLNQSEKFVVENHMKKIFFK